MACFRKRTETALGVTVADRNAVAVGADARNRAGWNSPSYLPRNLRASSAIFSSSVLMKGTTLSIMSSDGTPG